MEFLNFGLGPFLAMFAGVSGLAVALYLLDRTRRSQVVSTLRFWVAAGQPAPVSRRHKIQQPVSLLLQILGMGLILLALADFQFGGALNRRRDHVLILDTSAWMAAALPGRADLSLMDSARARALGWLRAVPSTDRVLLVRGDGLATPATAWETDRRKVVRAILESQPGVTTLNLSQSLGFAGDLQRQSGASAGEIVYAGPGRISAREASAMNLTNRDSLRVLPVEDSVENAGLRSMGARRSATDPGAWDVLVRVRNYGHVPRTVNVTLNFDKAPQGLHALTLAPGAEQETTFQVRTEAAGILETRLYPKDAFAADNYAVLEIPQQRTLHVTVYSNDPESIRPALLSDARVKADFRPPSAYTTGKDGLVVLDRFRPAATPQENALWLDPPADKPPVPIRERIEQPAGLRWIPGLPLTKGLRAGGPVLEAASIFEPGPGETIVAEVDKGPVAMARGSSLVMGFNPFAGRLRYELSTPILLANILRWAAPAVFRDLDAVTQSAGLISSPLPAQADRNSVQVVTEGGAALPFDVRENAVHFFVGEESRVRVIAGASERVYSLTLPEMWDAQWSPPASARRGIPPPFASVRRIPALWRFLAAVGAALLLAEWILYGSFATARLRVVT